MKKIIVSLTLLSLISFGTINTVYGQEKQVYKNIINDPQDNSTTIEILEKKDAGDICPLKQYKINYSDDGQPKEKIVYQWNNRKGWIVSERYEYQYNAAGQLESFVYSQWDKKNSQWGEKIEHPVFLLDINQELLTLKD